QFVVAEEVAGQIEDGTVQDQVAGFDRLMSDGLDQECFADARWTQQQNIRFLPDELAAGQIVDLLEFDQRIEGEVELVEVFDFAEKGGFDAAADQSAGPHVQFVLEDQLQKQ